MSGDKENKITLYPSNWLYNAGVVGLLRIMEWTKGNDVVNEVLSEGLDKKHLDNFETYYFEYAIRTYLRDEFFFSETRKAFGNTDKQFTNILREHENDFRKEMDNFTVNDSWENYLNNLRSCFEVYTNRLKKISKEADIKNKKIEKALDKDFDQTYQKTEDLSAHVGFLKRFYFNKKVIGNYSRTKNSRIDEFRLEYLENIFTKHDIEQDKVNSCFFCSRNYSDKHLSEFTEGDFAPVGVSASTFTNLFYTHNGKTAYPQKCPICQLVILCAFAGFNKKSWQITDIEGTDYIFINIPSVKEALNINNSFHAFLKNYQLGTVTDNLYYKGVEIVVSTLKKKFRWLIDNTLFVEANPTATKQSQKPKFTYFNIDRASADVFSDKEFKVDNLLRSLAFRYEVNEKPTYLSTEIIKRILTSKSVKPITFKYIKDYLNKKQNHTSALWALISLEHLINQRRKQLKRGDNKMSIRSTYGILNSIRRVGNNSFISEIDQDKRYHIAQRFLSLVRGGRKEDFYNELLRLYVVYEKQIPDQVFSLLSENDFLTFQEKALAFITGFVDPSKQKSETLSKEEGENG